MRYAYFGLLFFILAQPALGGMYKWVDDKGVTHYGDTLPPQYAGKKRSELDQSGVTIKQTPAALTPAQIKAREEAARLRQRQQQQALARKRKDTALLDSYSNEHEIDLARDRNLQHEVVIIQGTQLRIKSVQARLDGYRKRAAALAKAGRPAPADLAEDMRRAEQSLQRLARDVRQHRKEKEAIRARYEADKLRYRELTGGGQAPQ